MQAIRSDSEKTLVARGPSTYGSRRKAGTTETPSLRGADSDEAPLLRRDALLVRGHQALRASVLLIGQLAPAMENRNGVATVPESRASCFIVQALNWVV
jgi:hypothetical protein